MEPVDQSDAYWTLAKESRSLFKDKGSKHYGYALPVSSEEDVRHALDRIRQEHHTARHVAYAYRLGLEGSTYRASDDGEPHNSAGAPILGQLRSLNLTFSLVAVVRYFGGTKLGIPGLINAYKTAARQALDENERIQRFQEVIARATCSYASLSQLMHLLDRYGATIHHQDFDTSCTITFGIRYAKQQQLFDALQTIANLTV